MAAEDIIAGMALPERIGRYLVLELLGQGAMGTVYRGRDLTLDRDVALKVMSAKGADADARARFAREARAAARLQHPNIITIYELGEHAAGPFMALELLEGLDLQRAIESGIKPDPRLTLPVVLQVLAGLAHAHDAGIVHRDIKPSNVFLPRDRPAKVMDFGVARLAGGTTTGGLVVGTPNYMSPEQVRAAPDLDGRSDLFSVGLILYELVTGEKAYAADTLIAVLYKIANEDPDLGLIPRDPAWKRLREVLGRALAKSPGERYPDASTMADDVARALRDLGGTPDPRAPADQILRFRQAPRPAAVGAAPAPPRPPTPPAEPPSPPPPARATPLREGREEATAARGSPPSGLEPGPALGAARESGASGVEAPRSSRGLFIALGALALLAFGAGLALLPRGGAPPSQRPTRSPQPTLAATEPPGAVPTSVESKPSSASLPPATGARAVPTPKESPASTPAAPAIEPAVPPATTTPARPPAATAAPKATFAPSPATLEPASRPSSPAPAERPSGSRDVTDEARLERAEALFERGQYAAAAAEAKALLGRDPGNARAREILEDAEVEIAVESALRAARQALREGDRARALTEVERGLARKPTDGRLTALLRQLRP
jgi:serine/threonine-protein kinase